MLITSNGDKRRPNNVSDVRPSSCRLREYTVHRVGSRCSLCLFLYYLFLILQHYCPCSVIVRCSTTRRACPARSTAASFSGSTTCGTSSGPSLFFLELRLGSLFEADGPHVSERTDDFRTVQHETQALVQEGFLATPGARPEVHLPRDLIDVLRSSLAVLNAVHIVSVFSNTSLGVFLKLQRVHPPATACTSMPRTLQASVAACTSRLPGLYHCGRILKPRLPLS
ncbi:hypothetical protein HPB51_024153 [Rhipicephalus microplus]|uniref:Uncharacterized protein n=1 Tax=Rhipicephalus microplus TaxID=6941 RepID=A0A9J6DD97_RHIMP|nr:hypothetical protein HPB51_024153 [Rhipicephalus microplus]